MLVFGGLVIYRVFFSFQDSCISTSMPVLDLVDSIKPGSVNYELVDTGTDEDVSVSLSQLPK